MEIMGEPSLFIIIFKILSAIEILKKIFAPKRCMKFQFGIYIVLLLHNNVYSNFQNLKNAVIKIVNIGKFSKFSKALSER